MFSFIRMVTCCKEKRYRSRWFKVQVWQERESPDHSCLLRTGWIGGMIGNLLTQKGFSWEFLGIQYHPIGGFKAAVGCFSLVASTSRWASSRLQDRESVERELLHSGCTHVMNAAGLTGRPNVDWCETHRQERCCC